MVALRRRVVATVDERIAEDACEVVAVLKDGRHVHVTIEHAVGSMLKPMSDTMLDGKFTSLSEPLLGAAGTQRLLAAARQVGSAADLKALAALAQATV